MSFANYIKRLWNFLKEDSWQSWIVSLILIIIFIKLILFPSLSLVTGTSLPLVIVESCSMYHESSFDDWWNSNSEWYESKGISKEDFEKYTLKNGLNKGDIVLVLGNSEYKKGDIIIYNGGRQYPIIHRIISENPIETKGDHNQGQLPVEQNIPKQYIIGKAKARIPLLGWVKLIFFESFKPQDQRGLCK